MAEEIKIYQISGRYVRLHKKYKFSKQVRAISEENALDKVLSLVSSQKLKRRKITIDEVKTITIDECDDMFIQSLSEMQ